jgi:hypothetical protein
MTVILHKSPTPRKGKQNYVSIFKELGGGGGGGDLKIYAAEIFSLNPKSDDSKKSLALF